MTKRSLFFAYSTLILLPLLSYSNTFKVPFQFDDVPNILNNNVIHIQKLDKKSIIQTFFSNPTTPDMLGINFNRPVSFLSFGFNWYFGEDSVWGYHFVNTLCHIATTLLLYHIILKLILLKKERVTLYQYRYAISTVSALLWCLNPIQTQAVTYIVQRMAILAALFYLAGIYCYLKVKASKHTSARISYLLFAFLSYGMAVGAKENAITLPVAILLIEMTFYKNNRFQSLGIEKRVVYAILIPALFIVGMILLKMPFLNLLDGYQGRPFSLTERILTQPRVLLFYLSLIFLPFSHRFSIDHDIILSTGLFSPVSTFFSMLLMGSVLTISFMKRDRYPFLFFGCFFYFLNHIIESSILPLEMIFEHRNYLPSMFLFLPITTFFISTFVSVRNKNKGAAIFFSILLVGTIIFSSVNTYNRNKKWRTVTLLWEDAKVKAPLSARPVLQLAWQKSYGPYANPEMYDDALMLYQKALHMRSNTKQLKITVLDNIAGIYVRQKKYHMAVLSLLDLLKENPDYTKGRWGVVRNLIRLERLDEALKHLDLLLLSFPDRKEFLNLKGHILLREKRLDDALFWFQKGFEKDRNFWKSYYYLGVTFSEMKMYDKAEAFLTKAFSLKPDPSIYLSFIQNMLLAGSHEEADHRLKEFCLKFESDELIAFFKEHDGDLLSVQPTFQPVFDRLKKKKMIEIKQDDDLKKY